MSRVRLAMLILMSVIFALPSWAPCQHEDYPWVHYFQRPDMPEVHCAFANAEGDIIVSTGDWNDGWYDWGSDTYVYQYWSGGMFRIRENAVQQIECPDNTFVLDCATDSAGLTWVLFAEGHDYRQDTRDSPCKPISLKGLLAQSDIGYRSYLWPIGRWSHLSDYKLATLEEGRLLGRPELSNAIPGEPVVMVSDPQGRMYVMSWERSDGAILQFSVSWWSGSDLDSLHILQLWELIPNSWAADYPKFGPDGFVYLLTRIAADDLSSSFAVLCLNPDTGQYEVWSVSDYPFLDSEVYCFYVDQFNIKWFGTEDGLVLFDGENWVRFTTENSDLPYDRIKLVVYDEIDEVYYVGSAAEDWREHPDDYVAFSIFSPTGESMWEPSYMQGGPKLHRGAGGIWYLMPGWDDDLVYVYDHIAIREFRLRDWTNIPEYSAWDHYIASTAAGRTFFANNFCVMIW